MKYISFFILLFIGAETWAQDTLTLEKAVTEALKNNYNIRIAQNSLQIAKNNNTVGNAGMLPVLSASLSQSAGSTSLYQENDNGTTKDVNNAKSSNTGASVNLNWTIFNGMAMFISRENLKVLQLGEELKLKNSVENTISDVIASYYDIVQLTENLRVLENNAAFSSERKSLILSKFKLGSASELNALQAAVDLNTDSAALLKQKVLIQNAKAVLNNLTGIKYSDNYNVTRNIDFDATLQFDSVMKKIELQNSALGMSDLALIAARLNVKAVQADYYPKVSLYSSYTYSGSQSDLEQINLKRTNGLQVGISLQYNIFNGLNDKRNMANAKLRYNTAQIQAEQLREEIDATAYKNYNNYLLNINLIKFETDNVVLAKKNTVVAFEKYRLGQLSDIELRQTQLKQADAEYRLLQARYRVKLFETELKQAAGMLLK